MAGSSAARDAAGAADSPFRRHWTWRDRAMVAVVSWAIATVLRVVYATLRVRWSDPHGVLEAHAAGTHVVWATWHDGILLLPLMKVRVRPALRPRVVLSWHRDGEIAAQAVRRFGVLASRGSATRGWLGAVRGLLAAHARGEDLVVIPDGPRGPRHRAQEGVVQVASATHLPVVAIGIAAAPMRRLRTWDRLMLPRPFGRIALVLSAPIPVERGQRAQALAAVESALEATARQATASLGACVPVTERAASAAYRGVMQLLALVAEVASRAPAAPPKWRALGDRLGRLEAANGGGPTLWIHAASVGELRAVRPLLAALRARRPGRPVVVTTLTRTGLDLARSLSEVDRAALLPLDAPELVQRMLATFRPEAFFFTETEIWPTLLGELTRRGVPVFLVSGRVSPRTAGRAAWLRPFYRPALAGVVCCMQTAEDAERVTALGAEPALVHVAGSLKFETVAGEVPPGVWTLGERVTGRPVVVAGSTHDGEEVALLDACTRLMTDHPRLLLLLAPRHPERLESVARLVADRGLPLEGYAAVIAGERSVPEAAGVVLLDVMGPLAHCYALGRVTFVGGSLVPVGGHNVLEPARAARPVLVGPHTGTMADAVDRILAAGGGVRVHSTDELAAALARLLADPAAADEMGRRARAAIQLGEGALVRHLALIDERLAAGASPRAATV